MNTVTENVSNPIQPAIPSGTISASSELETSVIAETPKEVVIIPEIGETKIE